MKFVPAGLAGIIIVEPDVYRDSRGYFLETYNAQKYTAGGIDGPFVQDNHSRSTAGTLRGLHLQLRRPQGKLIRVIEGEIFDVSVDVRRGSPSFGQWAGVKLSADNFKQCYVPPGFAHGFAVVRRSRRSVSAPMCAMRPTDRHRLERPRPRDFVAHRPAAPVGRDRQHPMLADVTEVLPVWRG